MDIASASTFRVFYELMRPGATISKLGDVVQELYALADYYQVDYVLALAKDSFMEAINKSKPEDLCKVLNAAHVFQLEDCVNRGLERCVSHFADIVIEDLESGALKMSLLQKTQNIAKRRRYLLDSTPWISVVNKEKYFIHKTIFEDVMRCDGVIFGGAVPW